MILNISIILFIILETSNVFILYFKPNSKLGNGVAVFQSWKNSKNNVDLHKFVQYLINWVAGSKLVFIFLLIVILFTGSESTKVFSIISMILSITVYFWRLDPLITELDNNGMINPKGYSLQLKRMIIGFLFMFSFSLIVYFILHYNVFS